ncbi:MAG: N-acetyl-gamma-glutamyl-phosphate reductase [Candidatus Omnitrophota bacterium]|nr:MAG: N-acetyl-gamma-glutamyl-phosphate reductase [Candidatus Omnitrophota bacterium]
MISVGIVGATGYAGEELIGVLLRHPNVRITYLCAKIDKAKPISEIFPKFKGKIDLVCKLPQIYEILNKSELLFLALPHTVSMKFAPQLLKAGKRVIDLSADYRLKQLNIYEKYYKCRHTDRAGIQDSVYGLPELYRAKIKKAKLIANPGCYPTGAILALAPLAAFNLADLNSIIIDAKSGVTGAGRKANFETFFSELNEDFKAYKVNKHQHMPEINQEISKLAGRKIQVTFVPHLLPLNRGILSTIYVKRSHKVTGAEGHKLTNLYKKFYKKEPFVRIREDAKLPQLKDVVGTNFCDIGIVEESDKIIIICALDNLMKGASGQAVQNMNIMYGFPEHMGLI